MDSIFTFFNKSIYSTNSTLLDAKREFLLKIKGGEILPYKRYVKSPLRYAGGKSLAVGFIIERLPDNIERIISPFIGGGSVEIACAAELGLKVIGYDIFDILCNYWDVQLNDPEELYKMMKEFEPNRSTFDSVKKRLKEHWKEGKTLSRVELAAHYYFNSNTSYGPHFLGWPSDIYLEKNRYEKMILKSRNFRAPNLSVECASFENVIPKYRNDFLYCDPPYFLEEGKMFVGMYPHRNFPIHHIGFRHDLLRELLLKHKGGFVLSYNDCKTIREWYKDFEMYTPKWQYTFGQGDTRIGENRMKNNNGSHIKKSHELLILRKPK